MRATYLKVAIVAFSLISVTSSSTRAEDLLAPGITTLPQAPVGHRQPRADNFTAQSGANIDQQQKLASFDAEQARLDRALDSKLHICNHC